MAKNVRDTADASAILNSFRKSDNMGAEIAAQTKWLATTGKKVDAVIHAVAVGSIYMSLPLDEGGFLNADPALNLIRAMPKGSRAKALAAWFEAFSNVRLTYNSKKSEWSVKMVPPTHADYKTADPAGAFAKPFWVVEEAPADPKAFLLGARLARLIKLANKPDNLAEMTDDEKAFLAKLTEVAATAPKAPEAAPEPSGDVLENAG